MTAPARSETALAAQRRLLDPFYVAVESVLVGQRPLIDGILIALLTDGHALLEGVPGLAKTLTVRTIAAALDLEHARIQFTPDLLPADVLGTQIYNPKTGEFTLRAGPVFTNVLLADEINRAPAKVQSALLEAMQERQVTLGDESRPLPTPFLVLATQNPIEQDGTYPLPEAQLDRFLLKLKVDYPTRDDELKILARHGRLDAAFVVGPTLSRHDLNTFRSAVDSIHVDSRIQAYLVDLVRMSRSPAKELAAFIQVGASPRGSLALLKASKGHAFLNGRHFVSPEDVQAMAGPVLRHRVLPSFEAEAEGLDGDALVKKLIAAVPVP